MPAGVAGRAARRGDGRRSGARRAGRPVRVLDRSRGVAAGSCHDRAGACRSRARRSTGGARPELSRQPLRRAVRHGAGVRCRLGARGAVRGARRAGRRAAGRQQRRHRRRRRHRRPPRAAAARHAPARRRPMLPKPSRPTPTRVPIPADDAGRPTTARSRALNDVVVAAVRAALPADVLAALPPGAAPPGRASGAGAGANGSARAAGGRWRAAPASLRGGLRLALVDTLRAAAPWQKLRRAPGATARRGPPRRPAHPALRHARRGDDDLRGRRQRLGGDGAAGGGQGRGRAAARRGVRQARAGRAGRLPRHGAATWCCRRPGRWRARKRCARRSRRAAAARRWRRGSTAARDLARTARSGGRTPFVVHADRRPRQYRRRRHRLARARRGADATTAARGDRRRRGIAAAFVDTSARPRPEGAALAAAMGARYAPLPRGERSGDAALVARTRGCAR